MAHVTTLQAALKQKDPSSACFVEVPTSLLKALEISGNTPIKMVINGVNVDTMQLAFCEQGRNGWSIDISRKICQQVRIRPGDLLSIRISPDVV